MSNIEDAAYIAGATQKCTCRHSRSTEADGTPMNCVSPTCDYHSEACAVVVAYYAAGGGS